MKRCLCLSLFTLAIWCILALGLGFMVQPAQAQKTAQPDLTGYRTVDKASTTRISKASPLVSSNGAYLGIHALPETSGRLVIDHVDADSPAAIAGLSPGDQLSSVAGETVSSADILRNVLKARAPGEAVQLAIVRDKKELTVTATLAAASKVNNVAPAAQDNGGGKGGKGGFDNRVGKGWKKSTFRLAVIGIEYSDLKHNPKVTAKHWEDSMFSTGIYNQTSATGQKVYGSLNDYFREQSFGKLKVEGKVFPFVQVSKKRMDYASGNNNKTALFNEACEKIIARDGKDALNNFDGVFFLYAGSRPQNVARGSLYWPHKSNFAYQGQRWPYFIVQEGGDQMNNISVFCHEFGHMLNLPDLYAAPERPGAEGLGNWCAMSNQLGNGRPQHFGAWAKEQLGWITPTVIDPAVKQKLILSPIEDSPKECIKVLVKPDGSEYYLLENRKKKGFDSNLPGEGLLIWRVASNRPVLEESHGVAGPTGPNVFKNEVPFPSSANDAFTPYTTPSSRSLLGGGLPVFITNIRKLPDGRITFQIGYEYL